MRKLILIAALLVTTVAAFAQKKKATEHLKERTIVVSNVDPAVMQNNWHKFKGQERLDTLAKLGKPDMFVGSYVYAFRSKEQRQAFIEKYFDQRGNFMYDDEHVDQNDYVSRCDIDVYGKALLDTPNNAIFLVFPAESEFEGLDKQEDGGPDGNGIGSDDHLTILMSYKVEVMEQVEKTAKYQAKIYNTSWSDENYKYWTYRHPIDSIDARPEERLALFPQCYEYESQTLFKSIEPVIVEGSVFHENQIKRMGFDYKKYDQLAQYYAEGHYMKKGQNDTIEMADKIGIKRRGKHYIVNLKVMRLGYDNVIDEKVIEVDDGRDKAPLRYVEFIVENGKINYDRYEKTGEKQEGNDVKETNLFFKVGKAVLEADDYEGLKGLEAAKEFTNEIANNKDIFRPKFTIEGYASPEGNYQSNADLARRRAQYLKEQLQRIYNDDRDTYTLAEPKVQPWTVVADTLESRGYMEEAAKIRDICSRTSDMNAQYQQIRNMSNYDYINSNILPLLRIDRITATYTIKRVLPPDEIFAQYQANKEKYRRGVGVDAYEYFHLMRNFEKDIPELEPLARVAYNKFKDDFKMDSTNRPWTLAAYHLGRCLIERKKYDTKLLAPYIKEGWRMNYPSDWNPKVTQPSRYAGKYTTVPVNDEAVVLLQIEMLCKMGRYSEALHLYHNVQSFPAAHPTLGIFLEVFERPQRILEIPRRNQIANTSKWNKLVAYSACCGEESVADRALVVEEALSLLRDTVTFRLDDPRVYYLHARLLFDVEVQNTPRLNQLPAVSERDSYIKYFNEKELKKKNSICCNLIKAFLLDETMLTEELMWDKYMPKGLYLVAKDYWESLAERKDNLPLSDKYFYQRMANKKAKEAQIKD